MRSQGWILVAGSSLLAVWVMFCALKNDYMAEKAAFLVEIGRTDLMDRDTSQKHEKLTLESRVTALEQKVAALEGATPEAKTLGTVSAR